MSQKCPSQGPILQNWIKQRKTRLGNFDCIARLIVALVCLFSCLALPSVALIMLLWFGTTIQSLIKVPVLWRYYLLYILSIHIYTYYLMPIIGDNEGAFATPNKPCWSSSSSSSSLHYSIFFAIIFLVLRALQHHKRPVQAWLPRWSLRSFLWPRCLTSYHGWMSHVSNISLVTQAFPLVPYPLFFFFDLIVSLPFTVTYHTYVTNITLFDNLVTNTLTGGDNPPCPVHSHLGSPSPAFSPLSSPLSWPPNVHLPYLPKPS